MTTTRGKNIAKRIAALEKKLGVKNRELEIESAVERVRAKALAMHRSEEISGVANVLRTELGNLNIPGIAAATITLQQENGKIRLWDITSVVELKDGFHFSMDIMFDLKGTRSNDWIRRIWDGKGKYFIYKQDKKSFKRTLEWTSKYNPGFAKTAQVFLETNKIKASWHPVVPLSHGKLSLDLLEEPIAEVRPILTKMGAAFDLAYKRFLDLKNAEAQAKEAEIQLALEKVRARSLAMHNTSELQDIVNIVAQQLHNIGMDINGGVIIAINDEINENLPLWASAGAADYIQKVEVPLFDKPIFTDLRDAIKKGNNFFTGEYSRKEKIEFFKHLFKYPPWNSTTEGRKKQLLSREGGLTRSAAISQHTSIGITDHYGKKFSDVENEILKRFGNVFEQSYTRFLDLQKAEAQAREAQIEAALEKIRSRSLAMHSSTELKDVIAVTFEKLNELNILHGTVGIQLFDWKKMNSFMWVGNNIQEPQMVNLPYDKKMLNDDSLVKDEWQAMKKGEDIINKVYSFKQKNRFFKYIFSHNDLIQIPATARKLLLQMKNHVVCLFIEKNSALFVDSFQGELFTADDQKIIKRTAKVFEQAYIRFLDLQKAEAQAREAQIEAALERVRAKAMAMHSSEGLSEVVHELRKQMGLLGQKDLETCVIHLHDESPDFIHAWAAIKPPETNGEILEATANIPKKGLSIIEEAMYAYSTNQKDYIIINEGEKLKQWFSFLKKESPAGYKKLVEPVKGRIKDLHAYWSFADFAGGTLLVVTMHQPDDLTRSLLRRFSNVFGLAYRRFADLKQAEAQAREAQIEAALERVRARTMGMHHSKELHDVIETVTNQLLGLGLEFNSANFSRINKDKSWELWLSTPQQAYPSIIHVPYLDHGMFHTPYEDIDFFTDVYDQKEAGIFFHHFFENTDARHAPEERKQFVYNSKGFSRTGFLAKDIWVVVSRYDIIPFTDEENAIIKRFAKVFEQSYTRFLDLQKAEAQAKEAEIELALERVRAKTMAMQKPSEFVDVVNEIGEQLVHLDFDIEWVNFSASGLNVSKGIDIWNFAVLPGNQHISNRLFIPYFEHPVFTQAAKELDEYIRTGKDFFTTTLNKTDKDSWLDQMYTQTFFKDVPEELKAIQYAKPGYTTSNIGLKDTWLSIGKLDIKTFTDEQHTILKRFGKAFGLAYTRFQDLQKAETQAREAQIQLSLERVRARAMAMHSSDELSDVLSVLFEQFDVLDIKPNHAILSLVDLEKSTVIFRLTGKAGKRVFAQQTVDLNAMDIWKELVERWKKDGPDAINLIHYPKEVLPQLWQIFAEVIKAIPEDARIRTEDFPDGMYNTEAYCQFGYIGFCHTRFATEEEKNILTRFATEFGRLYQRFLDLQNAEAQAREAQIEAGLERVRSRAMAMQTSEELNALIGTVFTELTKLDLVLTRCIIWVFETGTNDARWWMANSEEPSNPMSFLIKYHEHPAYLTFVNEWKNQNVKFIYDLKGKDKKNWDKILFNETELKNLPDVVKNGMQAPERVLLSASFNNFGGINVASLEPLSDEHFDILLRFAKVFDQTYTRFLDLQKAEEQAREAKIEAALEKVRARTMGMQKSDELPQAANLLFQQIQSLGMPTWSAGYCIWDDDKNAITLWMSSEGVIQPALRMPLTEDPSLMHFREAYEKGESFFVEEVGGEELKRHYVYLRTLPGVKETLDEIEKAGYPVPTFQIFHLAYFSTGFLLFITYQPVPEAHNIFQRFGKVFDQTYTRFLDLQKAEAQARESQIQLALERVRARTMAMQKSNELQEVVNSVYEHLNELEVRMDGAAICTFIEGTKDYNVWIGDYQEPLRIKFNEFTRVQRDYNDAIEKREELFTNTYSGEIKKEYIQFLLEQTVLGINIPEEQKQLLLTSAFFTTSLACTKNTVFQLYRYTEKSFSKEENDILKRFANVFEQSYTRFLDLQKAEAQAREAQIEAALERVRSRTMAMQRSDELQSAALLLFQQTQALGARYFACGFNIWDEDRKAATAWMAREDKLLPPFKTLSSEDVFLKILEAANRGESLFVKEQGGEELETHYRYMASIPIFKDILEEMKQAGLSVPTFQIIHCAFFAQGYLMFISFEPVPEAYDIFKRFAKAFEQTYTRFLDLQKAEAQARESQIQLALERVRARTMAMQKSEELPETSLLLFQQMKEFGETVVQNSIGIIKEEEGVVELSTTVHGHHEPKTLHVPINDPHVMAKAVAAWKAKRKSLTLEFKGQELKDYNELRNSFLETKVNFPEDNWVVNIVFFSKGWLSFSSNHEISKESFQLLERFAGVFDLTYTRFLDLKQAEGQARESQIQLALERVRARTMAMQKSEELQETAYILFQQFKELGEDPVQITIGIFNEEERKIEFSITGLDDSGSKIDQSYKMDIDEPILMSGIYKAWKEQRTSTVFELSGKELSDWITYRNKLGGLPQSATPVNYEGRRSVCAGFFSKGFISFSKSGSIPTETIVILERFAGVFDLTYTRFLDLKQAESQAKEAQIQLALERVRARTMAMQKSIELAEAAKLLYDEFRTLNIKTFTCGYLFIKEEQNIQTAWVTTPDGTLIPDFIDFPITGDHVLNKRYEDWRQKKPLHVLEVQGEVNKEHHRFLASKVPDPIANEIFAQIPDRVIFYCANFSAGYLFIIATEFLTKEEEEVIVRFAKVFELTYTRFLDLKKAEGQAKEAHIELALERVRARTMAMHRSEELAETAQVLFHQLNELNVVPDRIAIGIADEINNIVNFWSTDQAGSHIQNSFRGRLDERTVMSRGYRAWKDHQRSLVVDLHGDDLKEWIQFAREEMNIPVDDKFIKDRRVHSFAFFSHGWILVTTHEPQSAEAIQILERFASVFNLTYRRFLDLEKAEAQVREAQIEAALEKVRSRSLAMHKSDELQEVVNTVFERLQELNVEMDSCNIAIFKEDTRDYDYWIASHAQKRAAVFVVPYIDLSLTRDVIAARESGKDYSAKAYSFEEKNDWFNYAFANTDFGFLSDERKKFILDSPAITVAIAFSKHAGVQINRYSDQLPTEGEAEILKRFAKVFEQAYTRFLDLQKAEAQAREAQIEAALERVRAKAMAMHKSEDLNPAVATVFEELDKLKLGLLRCGIAILDKERPRGDIWITVKSERGNVVQVSGDEALNIHPLLQGAYDAWLKHENFSYVLKDEGLANYYTAITRTNFQQPIFSNFDSEDKDHPQYYFNAVFQDGSLFAFLDTAFTEEAKSVMKRFANVFNLTYKRFLDLQKAEAQARESQIQLALERVRARTMAMQKSDDLREVASVLLEQMKGLDFGAFISMVTLYNKKDKSFDVLMSSDVQSLLPHSYHVPNFDHPFRKKFNASFGQGLPYQTFVFSGETKRSYDDLFFTVTDFKNIPESTKQMMKQTESCVLNCAYMQYGCIEAIGEMALSEENSIILQRFAKVFDQTYTRFLDLQMAEANAREAQIEAGLERVRSRTMAMHSSDDVSAATATMFTELEKLGIENYRGGITNILPNRTQDVWSVNNLAEGKVLKAVGAFDIDAHPFWQQMFTEWEAKKDFTYYFLKDQDKEEYIKILNANQGYLPQALQDFPDVHFQVYYFNEGAVWTNSLHPHTEDDKQIMKRFASVFSLTFRRYQDLRKAEAQAKEATIEAALEKVRGKAMAMHNSNDLSATASMIFTELRKLGISPIRCGVGLLSKESRRAQLYSAGDNLSLIGWVQLTDHPVLEKIYDTWLNNEEYYPELEGEQLHLYYDQLLKGLAVTPPDTANSQKHYGHFIPFSIGCLYAWADKHYEESDIRILKRFASIIDLTFRRYFELQKSEENAKEAVKQAALDRIRADIASMRTINDLDRITPLIWNELTILGIPFIRCGVFIMDDAQQLIHTFLSTPDGKAIAAFHMPYDTPGNLGLVVSNWKAKKKYIDHWDEKEFYQFADILVQQGALDSAENYLKTIPKGGFDLHFLPFLQGMLYVGNTSQLNEEQIELIQHVADAFSTAYARYEDFNKLEAAKKQVENTLTDLKQAQQQLVQSEKMASLGELTAGIAHEIQNPLNFVNNFSDVSSELLDEMKNELEKGNKDDAIAIVEDVKQNLEKILHHGKRADAIVKGMLQHSRTSSGQKEMTDINSLTDEYLRLAFHGLRAKDKTFNAKFETHFDDNIGKVNVIPQDIGRVILNLINNAFYTVTEKKKTNDNGYEPTVTVTTLKDNGRIEIKVKDNGNGIPQKILDKIFQPFFTTKPTGQGTGLGLSLAYDIVTKGHGGELKVETKEGEGSEFVIQLPG